MATDDDDVVEIDETYTPLSVMLESQEWPTDYFGSVDFSFLDGIAYVSGDIRDDDDGTRAHLDLEVVEETEFELPFGTSIVLGDGPIAVSMAADADHFAVYVNTDLVRVRLPRTAFVPVIDGPEGKPIPDPDPDSSVDISLPVGVSFDDEFNFDIAWPAEEGRTALKLPRCMLGDTGVIIAAEDVIVRLSGAQALPDVAATVGIGENWRGLFIGEASVTLPPELADAVPVSGLVFKNCFIGTGGFTGELTIPSGFTGTFLGSQFTLTTFSLAFRQNALTAFELKGTLMLSMFTTPLSIVVGMDTAGKLTVDVERTGGLIKLTKEPVMEIEVDSIGFEVTTKGLLTLMVSGKVTPLFLKEQIKWPSLKVDKLAIDSDGKISVDGGWVDLPKQASLHLYSVTIEVTKIGFGNEDDDHRWIGFSGGVKVVDGLKAGASVKGLRIIWTDAGAVSLSLEGVGIELVIPNALEIKGSVSFVSATQEFRGAVTVVLPSISFTIEGQFVAGSRNGNKYFAIFLRGELPAGIPLGPTGLAIYGMAGLYAHNMDPDKKAAEGWYDNPDHSPGWYLRPNTGVSDLNKWKDNPGHFGVGAGITLGTFSDNGFMFSGRLLLVLSFPGPIILFEGKMNLFKKRSELEKGDPLFRALVVIEPGKSFLVDLDAHYKYKSSGELLDIRGSAEAFFDFQQTENWHINLGFKDPKRRVAAKVFKLFDVNGYFQLNRKQLDIGASWGFDKSYGYSALNVHVKSTMETAATVNWRPNHFAGSVTAQGGAELRAFGFHTGVSANATITGDVFDPFRLTGKFHVGIDLPWPLSDIGATVTLEWKRSLANPPPLPLPLQEASVEYLPKGLRWPAVRGKNLLPDADQGGGEFGGNSPPPAPPTNFNFVNALVVPADTDLGLTFSRPIDDPANVGVNPVHKIPAETIGNPLGNPPNTGFTVGYSLSSVVLEKVAARGVGETPGSPLPTGQGIGWITVAQKGRSGGTATLYGAWSPALPQNPGDQPDPTAPNNAQAKLMINAKSPFKYTAFAAKNWNDAFLGANQGYPCVPSDPNESQNADFSDFEVGTDFGQPGQLAFTAPASPFEINWQYGGKVVVGSLIIFEESTGVIKGLEVASYVIVEAPLTSSTIRIRVPEGTNVVLLAFGTPVSELSYDPLGSYGVFTDDVSGGGIDAAVTIESFDTGGNSVPPALGTVPADVDGPGTRTGLSVAVGSVPRLELTPVEPASTVEVQLFGGVLLDVGPTPRAEVHFLDADGAEVPGSPSIALGSGPHKFRLHRIGFGQGDTGTGVNIAKVVVIATAGEFVLERAYFRTDIVAVATSTEDPSLTFGPFRAVNDRMTIEGPNLKDIFLSNAGGGEFVILELIALSRRNSAISHTIESLALFEQDDAVLEPETNYRLTVRTKRIGKPGTNPDAAKVDSSPDFVEQVYLRTAPLPGIGVPDVPLGTAPPNAAATTGFEDLAFYVERTVPAVPPPAGGHTSPARAVYRTYDVSVEFNKEVNHVQLMYRLGRRDLSLRLYDGNSRPLLDAAGRVLLTESQWDRSNNPAISAPGAQWIETVSTSTCANTAPPVNTQNMRSEALSAPAEEAVLAPETLHQARLVPMLLHEAFVNARLNLVAGGNGSRLERWQAVNSHSAVAQWRVKSEDIDVPGGGKRTVWYVTEGSGIESSSLEYEGALASFDDKTKHDHPENWSDFRASVQIRWSGTGEVGIELRRGPAGLLRVSLLPGQPGEDPIVQLASVIGGQTLVRGQAHRPIPAGEDTTLIVDCIGPAIRVFQHGIGQPTGPVAISVDDAPVFTGTVALFSSGATNPRFSEIRVDDFRDSPSTAYRLDFITSKYANFNHHLHSFDDRLFDPPNGLNLGGGALASEVGNAIEVPGTPGSEPGLGAVEQAESRAFDRLEEATLGDAKLRPPERLEILMASPDGQTGALLVRSPEPLIWERTQLSVSAAEGPLVFGLPGDVKITGATFAATPAGESITFVVRGASNLTGRIIEWRTLPNDADPEPPWNLYYTFGSEVPFQDGTQVQVFSGDASGSPARAPGTVQRFVAASPAEAALHFEAPGVELRIRVPDAEVIHQRQIKVDDAFVPSEMLAIRKPDGTAFFLFPSGGAPLPTAPAALRLVFKFSRDAGSALPILRQGGDKSPEMVVLELEII